MHFLISDFKDFFLDLSTSVPMLRGETVIKHLPSLNTVNINVKVGDHYKLSSSYILFLHCVWWQTACNYPLTHSLHGRATHRLLVRIRGRFCSVPFSNILWKYICNLRLRCFTSSRIIRTSSCDSFGMMQNHAEVRSCVVSNLHRVPVKPSPRPCNCHNHLVFAMCSLQEALPSHCGSAERCIRRTIISPKSEYCFAL